jgi:hypothetical protein
MDSETLKRICGESLKHLCDRLRAELRSVELQVRGLKEHPEMKEPPAYDGQRGEMIAQSMLAVRDIEAARMRLGKVLQYAGDGTSIYDKA